MAFRVKDNLLSNDYPIVFQQDYNYEFFIILDCDPLCFVVLEICGFFSLIYYESWPTFEQLHAHAG